MSSKFNAREAAAFHKNTTPDGRLLEPEEREQYFERFLPPAPNSSSPSPSRVDSRSHLHFTNAAQQRRSTSTSDRGMAASRKHSSSSKATHRKKPIRTLIMSQLHLLIYTLIHFFFGIYIRVRRAYHAVLNRVLSVLYYHHRTPELIAKDVKALDRVPEHLSVILQLKGDDGLDGLIEDVAEVVAWCCSAKIPMLSVYEKTGILKSYQPQVHRAIKRTLHDYFGAPPARPTISLRAPHIEAYSPPDSPLSPFPGPDPFHINVLLISVIDGRSTMVDLTKTLADMSQKGALNTKDITSEVIDVELRDSVMNEPDLLLLFGDRVILDGYPPWQVRLTEIFHVPDNTEGVGYQVFLRALHRYAKAQMRFGRDGEPTRELKLPKKRETYSDLVTMPRWTPRILLHIDAGGLWFFRRLGQICGFVIGGFDKVLELLRKETRGPDIDERKDSVFTADEKVKRVRFQV